MTRSLTCITCSHSCQLCRHYTLWLSRNHLRRRGQVSSMKKCHRTKESPCVCHSKSRSSILVSNQLIKTQAAAWVRLMNSNLAVKNPRVRLSVWPSTVGSLYYGHVRKLKLYKTEGIDFQTIFNFWLSINLMMPAKWSWLACWLTSLNHRKSSFGSHQLSLIAKTN